MKYNIKFKANDEVIDYAKEKREKIREWYQLHPKYNLIKVERIRYEKPTDEWEYTYTFEENDYINKWEVIVNYADMTICKFGPQTLHEFNNDELELFDKLNFTFTKEQAEKFNQEIEDWF